MKGLLSRLAQGRFRISVQLYAGIAAAVAITMIASLVAWISFGRVGDAQKRVNEGSVPEMAAAFRVAKAAGTLVAAAPRLITATPESLADTTADIDRERQAFEEQLAALMLAGERRERTRELGTVLTANIDSIQDSVTEGFALTAGIEQIRTDLARLQERLDRTLTQAIDDQLFYAMTGYRALDRPPVPRESHFSAAEISRYRHLAGLQADANIATQLLASAFDIADAAHLDPLHDRFEATVGSIERSLASLGDVPVRVDIAPAFARLRELGLGDQGAFELRHAELDLVTRQQALLADNNDRAKLLVANVEDLVSAAQDSAAAATTASTQAISAGRALLLALNAFSIVGAALVAWLFVGRILLRRIARLSNRMRAMAGGELEQPVDISGRDEVADMAAALEVFRRHALEVQRLNLVEKLAEELRGKNDQLESALAELRRVQDQIVAREKLAALGELTAGVAHEIKNPLNFVKNFSEASEELLEEMQETWQEVEQALDDEQRELVQEIHEDLVENLGRIRHHSDRADRIVRDMLQMGRGAGDRQATDLNALLDEHVRLAFHSARASDTDFQLDIEQDLDDAVGEIEAVPQDLGRVFLNMVTNACYATDQRRRAELQAGRDYAPKLRIATKRQPDKIEVTIRDNGSGIPADVIEKIFNPFFTTKPTDQGTGLGLALSNDIVREHGGAIRVTSEPDSFTQMVVELPLAGATQTGETSSAGAV